ncbi:hypothetical protein BJ123_1462 [Rhodopseudomonas thermotolerans]|uniref:Plasmid recombination enzyme n=2 Tax=Rhodopseudomonas TaxID=1073 RepID=A0A336JY47_9BRAD|nr:MULTISPECIES: hypothetical protein [Rhodopseudomonas]RED21560.1 hypothetical protein BJ125_1462 [Rhodopseudomonas pentothenatexigens]REF87288.1 hypothetical protein BJ123_1462 [Rhodopseudomonas thermotolerans]SSW93643.1 hypothetical protein SAMN05892882_1462 [Rhodopseudomonas pentothenatexigens]
MSYQFIHVEAFSRQGAHRKNSTTRKPSMFDIRDEMIRAPHACPHVPAPQPPNVVFGLQPAAAFDLASARAAQAVDKLGRKLRPEALVVLVGVVTWPELTANIQEDAEARNLYLRWRNRTIDWLRSQWGDLLATVIEHTDEPRPHVHFIVVPELEPNKRLHIASIHAGYRAAAECKDAGGSPRDQRTAYEGTMKIFQDCYYKQVAVRFRFTRIGPRLQRLTREQWKERKHQAKILAREYARLDEKRASIERRARDFVATKVAEAEAAAQLKIDSLASQSRQNILMLKQEANRRIAILKGQRLALQDSLEEREALIHKQEEKISHLLDRLANYEGKFQRNARP